MTVISNEGGGIGPDAFRPVGPPVDRQSTDKGRTKRSGEAVSPAPSPARGWIAIRGLASFMPRHRGWFAKGAFAAVVVVAARLALPWPLRAVADRWLDVGANSGGASGSGGLIEFVPVGLDPVLVMGGAFLLIILALGLFDLIERFCFAQFSIGTVRDLRAKAFHAAIGIRNDEAETALAQLDQLDKEDGEDEENVSFASSGDMVARLIGDTARVKNGLQGFLVHVATNGLVFLGVTIILFTMDIYLGAIFAIAGLATVAVAVWLANRMFHGALLHRTKEGKLAEQIRKALKPNREIRDFAKINKSSGRYEASQTRTQGMATFGAHGIFGVTVLAALWVGVNGIEAGRTSPGDIVLFMMYALLMRAPVVQLARQGARTGKILGAAYRVVQVLKHGEEPPVKAN